MKEISKYDKILDAFQELSNGRDIQNISVSDIAEKAGISKGSIYYYFPSKDAIISALVERNYENALETIKILAKQIHIPLFTRMALMFQTCRNVSFKHLKTPEKENDTEITQKSVQEQAYIHQKYIKHLITELNPYLTEMLEQGIAAGELSFAYPKQLAEIVLIILTVKLDNTITPSTPEEIEQTILAFIALLEKGTDTPVGALNYLTMM